MYRIALNLRTTPFDQYSMGVDLRTTPFQEYSTEGPPFFDFLKIIDLRTTPIEQYFLGIWYFSKMAKVRWGRLEGGYSNEPAQNVKIKISQLGILG